MATLWVSTLNSGLQYYNRTADAFVRVPEFSQRYCQVFRITEDDQHNLWIGGAFNEQAFVAVRDHKTGTWEKFLLFRAAEGIYSMLQISENEFWLGSQSNGLFKWNRKTKSLEQHFLHDPNNPNSLPGNDIRKIVRDTRGNLWIATHDGGLCKFNVREKSVHAIYNGVDRRQNCIAQQYYPKYDPRWPLPLDCHGKWWS